MRKRVGEKEGRKEAAEISIERSNCTLCPSGIKFLI
jgi:hypothetical protein